MYSMNCCEAAVSAVLVVTHEVISPNWAPSRASGPFSAVTMPLSRASRPGSFLHWGQLGRASLRRPASSSSRNEDQMTMEERPAK